MGRGPCCQKIGLKRGRWAIEEDQILIKYIQDHGVGSWHSLPKKAGLLRCGKSCRLRWVNYLRTDLKRGNITAHEEDLIIKLHAFLGNRWSLIASQLSGRTDNEIKNHWNYHLRGKSSDVMGGPGNDNLPQHIIDNLAKLMAAVPNPPAEKKRKKKSSLSKDKNEKLMKLTGDIIIIDKDKNKVDKPQTLEACEERLLSGSDSWSEQQFQNIVSLSLGEQELAVAGYRHEESVFQTPPFLVRDYNTSSLLPWNDNDIDMETNLMEQLTMLHSLDELIMEEDLTDKSICHAEVMDTTKKQQHLPLVPSSFPSPTLISSCSSTFDQLLMSMSSDQLWTWEDHGYGVYGQGQDFVIEGGSSNSNSFMYV